MSKSKPKTEDVTPDILDKATTRDLLRLHVDRVADTNDPGELELVLQFFHFLHARRYGNPDVTSDRYRDFMEQLNAVVQEV